MSCLFCLVLNIVSNRLRYGVGVVKHLVSFHLKAHFMCPILQGWRKIGRKEGRGEEKQLRLCSNLSCLVLSCLVLSCLVLWLSCLVVVLWLSCLVVVVVLSCGCLVLWLSCLVVVLSCGYLVLSCGYLVLSCLVLCGCLVLFCGCLVLSCGNIYMVFGKRALPTLHKIRTTSCRSWVGFHTECRS